VFFVVNKRALGQVLTTPAYCLAMALSCAHLVTVAWEHLPAMRSWKSLRACLGRVRSLQPATPEGDGTGNHSTLQTVSAGVPPQPQVITV
jgi:hypothetical protein